MNARFGLLACMLWASATGVAHAQAPAEPAPAVSSADAPKVRATLSPNTVELGQVAKLSIEVDAPTSTEVTLPEQPFGGLELSDRKVQIAARGDHTVTTYQLDLLALEPGKVELPALTLRFVSASGELSSGHTEPQALTVRSLIANEPNAEPKPATQPLSVMRDDYTLAWVAVGLLAVALIALATLFAQRWLKRRPKPVEPAPPPRPAWDLAIERLHTLLAQKDTLFAENRGEEFVDGVSDALREYLGRRYGFDGLERTTAELMTTLGQLRPHKLSLSDVSDLLEDCDLVKFARAKPDANECQELWNGALGLIRATTPMTQPHVVRPSQPPPANIDLGSLPPPPASRPPPARASFPPPPRDPVPPRASLPPPPWAPGALEEEAPREPEPEAIAPAAEVRGLFGEAAPPEVAPPPEPELSREAAFARDVELADAQLRNPVPSPAPAPWPALAEERDSDLPDEPTVVAKPNLRDSLLPDELTPQVNPRASEPVRSALPDEPTPARPRSNRPPPPSKARSSQLPDALPRRSDLPRPPARTPAELAATVRPPNARTRRPSDAEAAPGAQATPRPPRPRSSIPPPPARSSLPPAPPSAPSTIPPPRSTRPPPARTPRPPKPPKEPEES